MNKNNTVAIIATIIALLLAPLLLYVLKFYNQNISEDSADWSNFASYFGGITGALTIPFSVILLVFTYRSQKSVEVLAIKSFENQKFEKRFFELFGIFNEYRFRQLETFTTQGTKENAKERNYSGIRFFIPAKQHLITQLQIGTKFNDAFKSVIDFRDINFEFYFRCLNNLLSSLEEIDPIERQKFVSLIKNSLSNDELFFIKYHDISEKFQNFTTLKIYRDILIENLYFDYISFVDANN